MAVAIKVVVVVVVVVVAVAVVAAAAAAAFFKSYKQILRIHKAYILKIQLTTPASKTSKQYSIT